MCSPTTLRIGKRGGPTAEALDPAVRIGRAAAMASARWFPGPPGLDGAGASRRSSYRPDYLSVAQGYRPGRHRRLVDLCHRRLRRTRAGEGHLASVRGSGFPHGRSFPNGNFLPALAVPYRRKRLPAVLRGDGGAPAAQPCGAGLRPAPGRRRPSRRRHTCSRSANAGHRPELPRATRPEDRRGMRDQVRGEGGLPRRAEWPASWIGAPPRPAGPAFGAASRKREGPRGKGPCGTSDTAMSPARGLASAPR
jgi:hypothetical protein